MENQDYDHVRNMTLMFFLDRLMDKPRTLHDLSCQFGTKGFTKEMRQIAGGSQSGLRKFLCQYPALFTVDGDQVTVTCYSNDGTDPFGNKVKRDYVLEACSYFKMKLEQYGVAEVPIKSLLGHRSQAPPEIRHISGQHIKEFRDFLLKFPDTFVVNDDHVILKSVLENNNGEINQNITKILEEEPLDSQLTHMLICCFQGSIKMKGPQTVNQLFHHLTACYPPEMWSKMLNNVQDLATFLKMNSQVFHLQANLVSLVPERLKTPSSTPSSSFPATPVTPTPVTPTNNLVQNLNVENDNMKTNAIKLNVESLRLKSPSPLINSGPSIPALNLNPKSRSDIIKALPENQLLSTPNPQSPAKQPSVPSCVESPVVGPTCRSTTSSTQSSPSSGSGRYSQDRPASFQQRLKSQIMKAVADNSAMDYRDRPAYAANGKEGNSLDNNLSKMMRNVKIITKLKDCVAAVKKISSERDPVVALDVEGVNLGPKGPMTLLQLATQDEQVYIFDVFSNPNLIDEGGLKEILESEHILKVAHDCRNDSAALYHQHSVLLRKVFDTQAAHAVLQQQDSGKPVYKVKAVSLNTLCGFHGAPTNPKKEQMKNLYRKDQKFWSRRPLTEDMIFHAAFDVYCLVPTVFNSLKKQLLPQSAKLMDDLCQEQVLAYIQPEEVKNCKKQRKIDMEVADLKQKLNSSNKQIVLSNREIRLLRYLELTDEERIKIEGSHKVARKLERLRSHGTSNDSGSVHSGSGGHGGDDMFSDDSVDEDEEDDEYRVQTSEKGDTDVTLDSLMESLSLPDSPCHSFQSIRSPDLATNGIADYSYSNWSPAGSISSNSNSGVTANCQCNCHRQQKKSGGVPNVPAQIAMTKCQNSVESGCQTLSTGDIVITKVYFEEKEVANAPTARLNE